MRITHIIFSFTTGGAETMLADIVGHQADDAEVDIIIINKFYDEDLVRKVSKQVTVYLINRTVNSKNPLPIIRLNILLFKIKPDAIHCHSHNIIPLLLPQLKKRAVLTVHALSVKTKYFKQYKKLFAISQVVKEDIFKRTDIHAILVYNGICLAKIDPKGEETESGIFRIVLVSRLLHTKKGQHLAIAALHILRDRGFTNIQLDLIGTGNSEQFLKELTIKHGLTEHVNFLGLKDRDYIYSHLKDYDLLIQPSLYEGFGLTVAEGMAAKVPVLVSDIDGPMEIIENGKYGFHFEVGNAEKLAEQLQYILSNYNSEQMEHIVEEAYKHVKENFEIADTVSNYNKNYN